MKGLFISIFALSLCGTVAAQVGHNVAEKIDYRSTYYMDSSVWLNPAMHYDKYSMGLSSVSFGYLSESSEQASLGEEGDGGKEFSFDAQSYVALENDVKVYGRAYYKSDRVESVVWNENLDYSIIYPYIVGDSIGGDMDVETYYFSGGYVKRVRKYTLGAELAYRAAAGFRAVDPRPHNTVSDLDVKLGVARSLGGYSLALSASGRVYKQSSTISYYADQGETDVFQMSGLGYDYTRFRGDQTSTRYEGAQWSGTLDLKRDSNTGLRLSLGASKFGLTKILTSLNAVPLNLADETQYNLDASYLFGSRFGIRLLSNYKQRLGTENILGAATDNVYPVISSTTPFSSNIFSNDLSLFISGEGRDAGWKWMVSPVASYEILEQSYSSSTKRSYDIANIVGGVDFQSLWRGKRFIYKANGGVAISTNINKELYLPDLNVERSVDENLLSNIDYLSSSYVGYSIAFDANYLLNSRYALSLGVAFDQTIYSQVGRRERFVICLGLKL